MADIRLNPEVNVPTPVTPGPVGFTPSEPVASATLGTQKEVPELLALQQKVPSMGTTTVSTVKESLAGRMIRGLDYILIPREEGFDPKKALGERFRNYTPDELELLYDSGSPTELERKLQDIEETRKNNRNMAAHPAISLASSLLDIDLALGAGVGVIGKASRLTRIAASVAATTGSLALASKGGTVTPLEATMWTVGAVAAAIPQVRKPSAPKPVSESVDDVVQEVDDVLKSTTGVHTREAPTHFYTTPAGDLYVRNPDGSINLSLTAPPDSAIRVQSFDELSNPAPIRDEYIPDPDYPVKAEAPVEPPMRYYTDEEGRSFTNVQGELRMLEETPPANAQRVDEFNQLFDEVQPMNTSAHTTTIREAVGNILQIRKDIPTNIRALGQALFDSLADEADVPMHFKAQLDEVPDGVVGYFKYRPTGPMEANVLVRNIAGSDLGRVVQSMTQDEALTALHEAMHSKVDSNLLAFEHGMNLPPELKKAAQDIQDTYDYVFNHPEIMSDIAKRDDDFNYAFTDIHEFVANLFNSPLLVEHLNKVQLPAENMSIWQKIKNAFTKFFTGKEASVTAMDKVNAALDTMFSRKSYWATPEDMRILNTAKSQARSSYMRSMSTKDMFNKTSSAINEAFSGYEALASFGGKMATLAKKLVVDSTGTAANSAAHYARAALLQGGVGRARVEAGVQQVLVRRGWNFYKRWLHPVQYKNAWKEFSADVFDAIEENARRYNDGLDIVAHADPDVERVLSEFSNTNWSKQWLDNIKAAGVEGAQDIPNNPWYLPREHNYNKIVQFLTDNPNVKMSDIEGMYTQQFMRMFADKGIEEATAKKLAKQMLRNIQDRGMGTTDWRSGIAGMGYDEIREALEFSGIEPERIQSFLGEVQIAGSEANKPKNLKHRLDFDMTLPYTTQSGKTINPNMFVNKDVGHLMEGYGRRMAGRVGLAKAGFSDLRALDQEVAKALQEVTGDARRAKELLDNNIKYLLGMPTGERVPDFFRSVNILSSATNLGNSGIFQLADTVLMMHEYGFGRTIKAMMQTKFGRDAFELARSPEYGKRLQDVLEGNLVLAGVYRPMMSHLDDNFDIGMMGEFHQFVQRLGQNTRFASGLESVRRGQIKLFSNLVADTLNGAIAGNAGDIWVLQRYGLTDELLGKIRRANTANPDARTWGADVLLDTQAMLTNAADGVVLENRLGDIAPWMQFSSLGKVILPYLTFVSGAWNKLLRRRYKMDGITGVAMAIAYQMPGSVLAAAASIGLKGKEIDAKKLAAKSITQIPIMSWFGYAVDFATMGPTNSIAALSIAEKMYSGAKSVAQGKPDINAIVGSVPWISIIPGMKGYAASIAEPEPKNKKGDK